MGSISKKHRMGPIEKQGVIQAYVMLVPTVAIVMSIVLFPLFANFWISFKDVTVSDSVVPTVDNVSSNDADALYTTGSDITIRVTFSEPVFVNSLSGYPRINLETGSTQRYAYYSSGNGSNILSFVYTVENGDCVSDLNYKSINSLENYTQKGAIVDNTTVNEATLTLPSTDNSSSLGRNKNIYINFDGKPSRC